MRRLLVRDALRMRTVCRAWCDVIDRECKIIRVRTGLFTCLIPRIFQRLSISTTMRLTLVTFEVRREFVMISEK